MAGMAAKLVAQFMETQNARVKEVREDLLAIGCSFEGGSIDIFFEFDNDDRRVHLEGVNFIKVPENKCDEMYKIVNECNDQYRHVKFVLDTEHGQIAARDDDIIQLDSCGPECFELMLRMLNIVQNAYPTFMKALWA